MDSARRLGDGDAIRLDRRPGVDLAAGALDLEGAGARRAHLGAAGQGRAGRREGDGAEARDLHELAGLLVGLDEPVGGERGQRRRVGRRRRQQRLARLRAALRALHQHRTRALVLGRHRHRHPDAVARLHRHLGRHVRVVARVPRRERRQPAVRVVHPALEYQVLLHRVPDRHPDRQPAGPAELRHRERPRYRPEGVVRWRLEHGTRPVLVVRRLDKRAREERGDIDRRERDNFHSYDK